MEGREKERGAVLERGRDGVVVVVLDDGVWSRDDLVATAATAGRNSKNYHSYDYHYQSA